MLRAAATDPGVGSGEGLVSDETCGDGMVDMDDGTGFFSFIAQLFDEQCDDGNTEDGDGCSADCRNEMVHLAGSTDVNATYAVLFIPAGWGDLAAFEAYAKSTAEGALAQDWYDEHTEEISFWALVDQEVDDLGRVPCAGPMDTPTQAHADAVWDRVDEVAFPEAVLARYEGALGIVDTHVVTHPVDCRNWTTFGGRAISLGLSERADVVMAHEIGHNLGWLDDEYAYGSCRPPRAPNTSIEDPIKWSCLAQNNGGAACPEGAPVHAYPVEGAGCDILRPCRTCMMLNYADFCPVCRAQMDARIVGGVAEIASNGADDDLDGDTDDGGCDCTPNSCPAMGCGGDGCFGECGCGAGQRCFAGACEDSCPGQTCGIDDIGHEVCDGDVYIYRGECPEGQALRCRCDAAGFALVDCSGCAG
jgi:cysteine-rich repeat protein